MKASAFLFCCLDRALYQLHRNTFLEFSVPLTLNKTPLSLEESYIVCNAFIHMIVNYWISISIDQRSLIKSKQLIIGHAF